MTVSPSQNSGSQVRVSSWEGHSFQPEDTIDS